MKRWEGDRYFKFCVFFGFGVIGCFFDFIECVLQVMNVVVLGFGCLEQKKQNEKKVFDENVNNVEKIAILLIILLINCFFCIYYSIDIFQE